MKSFINSLHRGTQACNSHALCQPTNTGKVAAYISVIRPYQWIKNLLVFAPLFFAGSICDIYLLRKAVIAALMFCIAASVGYVFNDWRDRKEDKNHPEKCSRPFALGSLKRSDGVTLAVILLTILLGICVIARPSYPVLICILLYFFLSLIYSFYLKKITLLEIFMVSFFFVMRVLAGGLATGIHISSWLFATVFFLSLLITVAKRKTEIIVLGQENGANHRFSLQQYSVTYLNNLLWAAGGVSIVTFALYAVEKGDGLVYSLIPATYGITRFIMLTDKGDGGDPILTLSRDVHLIICTVAFLLFIFYKIYA